MLIQAECIRGRTFTTRAEANLTLFECIDGFYDFRRIPKRLAHPSPVEFEEKHHADQATMVCPRPPADRQALARLLRK